ncbi:hypothetical protein AB1L42_21860 [Thalassoglobus sp. JC818]|uniref:hypothetical protein n=1 Tax=Thalassoglobus sp. JC818 TaxID=3232136 RepID=UPI00345B0127
MKTLEGWPTFHAADYAGRASKKMPRPSPDDEQSTFVVNVSFQDQLESITAGRHVDDEIDSVDPQIERYRHAFNCFAQNPWARKFERFCCGRAGLHGRHIAPNQLTLVQGWSYGVRAFAYDLIARTIRGLPWPDGTLNPRGQCVWINTKGPDAVEKLMSNLVQFGGMFNTQNVLIYTTDDDNDFKLGEFACFLADYPDVRLIVFDDFTSVIDVDSNKKTANFIWDLWADMEAAEAFPCVVGLLPNLSIEGSDVLAWCGGNSISIERQPSKWSDLKVGTMRHGKFGSDWTSDFVLSGEPAGMVWLS